MPESLHPTLTATDATYINLCPKFIATAAIPLVFLSLVSLHFELYLALPDLAMAMWARSVVSSVSIDR